MSKSVLIIDDEENMRHSLSLILTKEGYQSHSAINGKDALLKIKDDEFDFILCDIRMPEVSGIEFLKEIKKIDGFSSIVIMMSAYGSKDSVIEAMRLGAYDYISKPFKIDEVILTLKKALERESLKRENKLLKKEVDREYKFSHIITGSQKMLEIFNTIKKVSGYKTTVLILGESGTGKELIARAIHKNSNRSEKPFVAINCGAIPETLLESEFFGYIKGAFTDAKTNKKGLFEEADGGTFFLDEVAELSEKLQVKLLRVLQEGEIRRVGANKTIKVDVRIIAATVKDLESEIKQGKFREDLYYRLNVMTVKLPPLRERREDISALAQHFIEKYSKNLNKHIKSLNNNVLNKLKNYEWKGNIRELENIIERGVILANGETIEDVDLPSLTDINKYTEDREDHSMKNVLKMVEKDLIIKALNESDNNKGRASKILDISYRSLMYKLKEYGIE